MSIESDCLVRDEHREAAEQKRRQAMTVELERHERALDSIAAEFAREMTIA